MNKTLLLKVGKFLLKAGVGTLKFSAIVTMNTLQRSAESKDDFSEWQSDYDEYVRAVTGKGPYC